MSTHSPVLRRWVATLLVVSGCSESPPPELPATPNLVLVSIDSLRPDHLGCYGYSRNTSPFLDQLAAEGQRYENAVSTTSWTLPAHAALFTGLYDSTHGLVDNGLTLSGEHVTLAEMLSGLGYETAGFFGGPYLHPAFGLGQGFDTYQSCMTTTPDESSGDEVRSEARQPRGKSHQDITGPRTREEVQRWISTRDPSRPFFLFTHLWDVHYDFIPPAPYDTMFDPDYRGTISGRLMSDRNIRPGMPQRDLEHVLALYDGEIRFTDEILKGMFADLRAQRMLDNTLVIITADHGEEFFEHQGKGHNRTLFDEVLKVPLLVWWPGVAEPGSVVEDQVRLVDLLPTLAEVAGAPSVPTAGRSLVPLFWGDELDATPALAELMLDGQTQRALRTNRQKIYRPSDSRTALLLRLDDDPEERRPIGPNSPDDERQRSRGAQALEEIHQQALTLRKTLGGRDPGSIILSDAMRAELEALGYLDDGGDD